MNTKSKKIRFACHGWKDGVLTYTVDAGKVEIDGDARYNSWKRARFNGGEWIEIPVSNFNGNLGGVLELLRA